MIFTVHITDRTPEQIEWTERTFEAAKLLRQHGIPCEVHELCVFKPTDIPAKISLKEPNDKA